MGRRGAFVTTFLVSTLLAQGALADPATHQVSLTAKNTQTDCGGGKCVDACEIRATLKSLGQPSPSLAVSFRYENPGDVDVPKAYFDFTFPALAAKQTSSSVTDHVAGLVCKKIVVDQVTASCPDSAERCPGFNLIQIPAVKAPQISAQKLEAK